MINIQDPRALNNDVIPFSYRSVLKKLQQDKKYSFWMKPEHLRLEEKLQRLASHDYEDLDSWQRVQISRHAQRPKAFEIIKGICSEFEELFGDRCYRNDSSVICGLCQIDGIKFVCIAQEKGNDLESRMKRNFGMMHPEGYRKALRIMKLAEKFKLPVLTIIDTPGAYAGLEAEQRGQGWAIAENLKVMARLRTPIIALILSEGASGGAIGIGLADVVGMLEHAYYSVISPEGCASILWKDVSKREIASRALKLNSEHLLEMGIIDEVVPEHPLGLHQDIPQALIDIKEFIVRWSHYLNKLSLEDLLNSRYQKFRKMGHFEEKRLMPALSEVL
jgi:acetyl-CoA carboxylase carboxyl transferase subunit alpha